MPLYPGHNYLGPGNPTHNGKPIDDADAIAQVHDLDYSFAKSTSDVRKADTDAIWEFTKNFVKKPNLPSLAGAFGLAIKYAGESVIGVQYPKVMKTEHSDLQHKYLDYVDKTAHTWYNEQLKQGNKSTFADFYKQNNNSINTSFGEGGTHQDWWKRNSDEYKNASEEDKKTIQWDPHILNFKYGILDYSDVCRVPFNSTKYCKLASDYKVDAAPRSPDQPISPRIPATTKHSSGDGGDTGKNPNTSNSSISSTNSSSSNSSATSGTSGVASSIIEMGEPTPPTPVASSTTAPSVLFTIPKSGFTNGGSSIIHNTRIITSYAFASTHRETKLQTGYCTTPLALIPVDFLPFYMSPQEFDACVQNNARVKRVHVSVKCLGSRISFDTAQTVSGIANTEHVALGIVGIGLNLRTEIKNVKYGVDAKTPMEPNEITDMDSTVLGNKLWGTADLTSLTFSSCIPRHLGYYMVYTSPASDSATMSRKYGEWRLDKHVQRFLINSSVGQVVATYDYDVKTGYLTDNTRHPMTATTNTMLTNAVVATQAFTVGKDDYLLTQGGWNKRDSMTGNLTAGTAVQYERNLENDIVFNNTGAHIGPVQPQLHIGMVATPQLNHATEKVSFQQACVYWEVSSICEVELSASSDHVMGSPNCSADAFVALSRTPYNSGENVLGKQKVKTAYKRVNDNMDVEDPVVLNKFTKYV